MARTPNTAAGPIPHRAMLIWLKEQGLTQNDLARRLGREPSFLSRVLRGKLTSLPTWVEIRKFMIDPDTYRMPTVRERKIAQKADRARQFLRQVGWLKKAL